MSKGQFGSWSLHQQRLEIFPPGEMRTWQCCQFSEPPRRVQLPQCQEKGLHSWWVSVIRSFPHNWRGDLSVAEINCIICQLCLCSPAHSVCVITCYDYVWTSKWEQRRLNSIKFPGDGESDSVPTQSFCLLLSFSVWSTILQSCWWCLDEIFQFM